MKITLLGTGTSLGIPIANCDCPVCNSDIKENNRYRSSLWLQHKGTSLIIDTSPEFRLQTVRSKIKDIDAVLITHTHPMGGKRESPSGQKKMYAMR